MLCKNLHTPGSLYKFGIRDVAWVFQITNFDFDLSPIETQIWYDLPISYDPRMRQFSS